MSRHRNPSAESASSARMRRQRHVHNKRREAREEDVQRLDGRTMGRIAGANQRVGFVKSTKTTQALTRIQIERAVFSTDEDVHFKRQRNICAPA